MCHMSGADGNNHISGKLTLYVPLDFQTSRDHECRHCVNER